MINIQYYIFIIISPSHLSTHHHQGKTMQCANNTSTTSLSCAVQFITVITRITTSPFSISRFSTPTRLPRILPPTCPAPSRQPPLPSTRQPRSSSATWQILKMKRMYPGAINKNARCRCGVWALQVVLESPENGSAGP